MVYDLANTQKEIDTHVLVVEDNQITQNVIQKTLSLTHYTSDVAPNGQIALKLIKECTQPYDIIFLDLLMPLMDGITTIREIRKLPNERSKIKVVAVTGEHHRVTAKALKILGFNAAILKPFNCGDLVTIVDKLLSFGTKDWLGFLFPKASPF